METTSPFRGSVYPSVIFFKRKRTILQIVNTSFTTYPLSEGTLLFEAFYRTFQRFGLLLQLVSNAVYWFELYTNGLYYKYHCCIECKHKS